MALTDVQLLEQEELDPAEWLVQGVVKNHWEGPSQDGTVTYHQQKVHAVKKRPPEDQIVAARTKGVKYKPRIAKPYKNKTRLIVVCGDQQAPFHDPQLHKLFCGWLAQNKPQMGIALGDKVDFPDISQHRLDPENTAIVNECIQAGYDLFRDYRAASLNTDWQLMPGNHDLRIRNILLDKPSIQPLYGVKSADTENGPGQTALGLEHLLRLDELGITYVDPHGPYELAQVNISEHLAVRHGWIVRKGSGQSALATLDHLGHSIITGHTHRQSLVHHTRHEIDGQTRTLVAAEAGCMCRVDQSVQDGRRWPNFVTSPDWQQGFCTVELWPDGGFKLDLATYVNGSLYWRDQRWQ
jgi:hypothetical protein